jgi:hypothetical protein
VVLRDGEPAFDAPRLRIKPFQSHVIGQGAGLAFRELFDVVHQRSFLRL